MMSYLNAVLVLLAWTGMAAYLLYHSRKIGYLKSVPTGHEGRLPSVALIIAVRNEEQGLEQALSGLAQLDYPHYKIILVDDGSTDGSPAIMEAFAARFPHIDCIHLGKLPEGWIGKSYALYRGYRQSNAAWLLFTDADVTFSADSLRKAMAHCQATGAHHLTVLPHIRSRSEWVNCVNSLFQVLFHLRYRPWAVARKTSNAYLGMGAFNLVQREAYEAIGTHARFALHPNDDLKLGQHLKEAGFHQQVLYGKHTIGYEWYGSLGGFINGLTKNAFSAVDYNLARVVMSSLGTLPLFVLPVPLFLLSGNGVLHTIALAVVLTQMVLLTTRKGAYGRWWYALLLPFSALVIVFIMLRSAVLTLVNDGLYWSKRFYSLNDLKKYR